MNKILRKIFSFLLVSFIVYNLIIFTFIKLYPEYFITDTRDYLIIKEQYERIEKGTQTKNLIIGDSRANTGILVSELGDNYANFALPGSTFVEGYFTVKAITKTAKIDTLILGYNLDYLMSGNHWFDERTIQISNSLINLQDVFAINSLESRKQESILGENIYRLNHVKRILKFIHLPIMYGGGFWHKLEDVILNKKSKQIALKSVSFHKGNFFFPQIENRKFKNKVFNGTTNAIIYAYSDSLISLCRSKNIKVFLSIPPSFDSFPPNIINSLSAKGYNLIKPILLTEEYFSDNTHLNEKGAVLYTRYLRKKINAL
jgi:hypothetical protein